MRIIQDTISGAVLLSVFDFIACFFVLYFISFFIRGLAFIEKLVAYEIKILLQRK